MRSTVVALSFVFFAGVALAAPRHVLLRTAAPLTHADRAELADKGIVVLGAASGGRYLARVADDVPQMWRPLPSAVAVPLRAAAPAWADSRIVAVDELSADTKIHSTARREAARGAAWAAVRIYFHDDVSFDDARSAILASGGALDDAFAVRFAPMHLVSARIAPASLTALAADDRVLMISGPRHFQLKTDNAVSAAVSHVTELQGAPYGLTGAGVAVSLFELAEAQASHPEFGGRLTVLATGGATSDKTHATHVAGTIGASGVNSAAKGMAPKATLYQFKVDLGRDGEPLYHTAKDEELSTRGVVADNNSWGFVIGWSAPAGGYPVWDNSAEYFGAYDYEYTAPLDQISRDRGVLFVHSSGNEADDGPGGAWNEHRHRDPETGVPDTTTVYCYSKNGSGNDCAAPCTTGFCETTQHHTASPFDTLSLTGAAKNVITVGAVSTTHELLGLSSRGPAKDGRVKPDVVARGASVLSSVPTNTYATASGTSMASPVVTGIATILAEQWRRTFGTTPKPEQLKAVIIAGAEDIGNPGPDYSYGFGLVNAKTSVDLVLADHADFKHIRSTSIQQGQQYEMPVVVQTQQDVRVVLQWPDPPVFLPESEVFTAKALVNDLDLKVVGPTGTTYLPYVLDKANVNAPATRGVNSVDNTEMVEIANAAPGAYRIVVNGTAVNQGPQNAVIVTTARAARVCRDIQEPNDSSAAAYGNLGSNSFVTAGFCTSGDVDYFKFLITKNGPVTVDVNNTGDTPLRATLIVFGGETKVIDVPAYSTAAIVTQYTAGALPVVPIGILKFEPTSAPGVEPDYAFTLKFGQENGTRRRSTRH